MPTRAAQITRFFAAFGMVLCAALGTSDDTARAFDPLVDPRLAGVALSDIQHPAAQALVTAVAAGHITPFEETLAVVFVSGTSDQLVVDVVGRSPRFASLDRVRSRAGGLGIARLEVPLGLADGRSDLGAPRVVLERAFADMHPILDVSLGDQVAVLEDFDTGFRRVWPIGIGAVDTIRRPGRLASLTPTTDGGRLDKHEALAVLGGWNRGKPYLPLALPYYGQRPGGLWRRWFYETRVAFHAWPGQTFIRGYVSRGCIILRDQELDELYAVVQSLRDDLAFGIHVAERADVFHPFPRAPDLYWRLQDFGRPGKPEYRVYGNLYVIEKVLGPVPDRKSLVDIYSDGEARHVVALATGRGCGPVPVGLRRDDGHRCVPETAPLLP